MSWDDYRQRKRILDDVLRDVQHTPIPAIAAHRQAEIDSVFGGTEAFLLALHYRWFNTLTARLDAVLEDQPADPTAAVERVWRELAIEQPSLRSLLTAYADHPALRDALGREQQLVGWAPGADLTRLTSHGFSRGAV